MSTEPESRNSLGNMGRYVLKRELARGGMAIVYLAYDPGGDRDVAIKVIKDTGANKSEYNRRFQREIRVVAKLEHAAIVPVYDVGEHDNQPYLVMRHMPGRSLRHKLESNGSLPLPEVCFIAKRVADALEKAHGEGIIHRDIKPANVLFDAEGLPYLSDFGIYRLIEDSPNLSYTVAGTPPYMAPEQWNGTQQDKQTDVYQLGVTMFETVSGHKPFSDDYKARHLHDAIPSVRHFDSSLPPELDEVFQKALAKDPGERFETPQEMVAALWRAAGEEQIIGRYQIRKQIGNSRLATVFLAYDSELSLEVALKIFRSPLLANVRFQRAFRKEAEALMAFAHDAVNPIYHVFKLENRPHVAMRYCAGGTLGERVRADGPLPLAKVCDIAARVAAALQAIHEAGRLHRDVKPGNLLLDGSGKLYLSDLGTLTIGEQTTEIIDSDHLLGSFAYLAPEQSRGDGPVVQTDVYQFGVTLFELLTGKRPFADATTTTAMNNHLDSPIPAISSLNANLPTTLDAVFRKALARSPQDRYATPQALATAVQQAERQHILATNYDNGQKYYRRRQWDDAVDAFEAVVKIDSTYQEAVTYLERAKENGRNEEIYARGIQELARKRWGQAEYWLGQIPDYEDTDVHLQKAQRQLQMENMYTQGRELQQNNRLNEARRRYEQILEMDADYRDVRNRIREIDAQIPLDKTLPVKKKTNQGRGKIVRWVVGIVLLIILTASFFAYMRFPTTSRLTNCLPSFEMMLEISDHVYEQTDTVSLSSGSSQISIVLSSTNFLCQGLESVYEYSWEATKGDIRPTISSSTITYEPSDNIKNDFLNVMIIVPDLEIYRSEFFKLIIDD